MRFLIFSLGYHPELDGGAWRYAAAVSEGLARQGHAVDVICPAPQDGRPAPEHRNGVRLHWFPRSKGNFWVRWYRDNRQATALGRSLMESHGPPQLTVTHHAYFGRAFAAAPAPRVYMFHGPWHLEFRARRPGRAARVLRCLQPALAHWFYREERRALQAADRVFVVSRFFENKVREWHRGVLREVQAISAGVDEQRFDQWPDRAELRREFGLAPEDFLFLTLRRLDTRMGLHLLLDAFTRIAPAFPSARLWMAGKGPEREAIENRIRRDRLERQVRLLGFLPESELPRILNAADCTMMPSLDLEGFGLATVESLACGTPVLGSDAGATPEILRDLDADLVFPAGSVDAAAAAMQGVLKGTIRLPDREECRRYVLERYRWDRPVQAFLDQAAPAVAQEPTP